MWLEVNWNVMAPMSFFVLVSLFMWNTLEPATLLLCHFECVLPLVVLSSKNTELHSCLRCNYTHSKELTWSLWDDFDNCKIPACACLSSFPCKQLPLYLRSVSALTPLWKKGFIEHNKLCFFNWLFCNTYCPLVGLWSASFLFLLENVLLVVADSGRHVTIRHAQVHKTGKMGHQEHVH
jgi:hypothetical protein